MGAILGLFRRRAPETPIKGGGPRVKNVLKYNFRGIFGVLIPFCIICWQIDTHNHDTTLVQIWILMFFFFLFQPVTVQVTGCIPIFALPIMGIMSTADAVACYFNEGIALFIVGGMLHLLLNNSGIDRRIALCLLCQGEAKNFSPPRLLCKSALSAFILSMFCHRLIVASTLIQYVTPVLMDMQKATARYRASEPNFDQVRYIICNAIQTSCSIGGIVIVHASYCTLAFRAIFYNTLAYPDFLNYAQYTAFALPLAIVIFLVNLIYHGVLLKVIGGKPISAARSSEIKNAMLKYKSEIPPKITTHEKLTIVFQILALLTFFTRFINSADSGWVKSIKQAVDVGDATVAAMFVIFLHILPRSCNFCKIFKAKKKSQLPPTKPESAILFWRFVDKNTNYAYFFLMGAGVALWRAGNSDSDTSLAAVISQKLSFITNLDFCIAVMVICIMSVFLANMISGVAAIAIWLPAVLFLSHGKETTSPWITRMYRPALGVGIGSSFGYISPFLYTPAYFCYHTGKVPRLIMLKYSLFPCLISAILLYLGACYFAPSIFGEDITGTVAVLPGKTTVAADAPAAPAPT